MHIRNSRKVGVTPVKVDRLKFFLHGYDSALASYLIDGFRFGFRVHFVGERLSYESPNLKSAIDQPDLVKAKLSRECAAGRIFGPFTTPPFPNFRTSPLGIVPKKRSVRMSSHSPLILPRGCFGQRLHS